MEILFKNTTKYTKKIYEEFLTFHSNTFKLSYFLLNTLVFLLLLFVICMNIYYNFFLISIILFFALAIFIYIKYIRPIFTVKNEYNSNIIQNEESFTFKFYDTKFSVENLNSIHTHKYSDLYKIYENSNFYYLYIDKTHSYILNKNNFITNIDNSNFENSTDKDFIKFLCTKVTTFKFKIKIHSKTNTNIKNNLKQ